jgi:hypothetical protein
MNPETKSIIAKEWLAFIGCFVIGSTVFPLMLMAYFINAPDTVGGKYGNFIEALFDKRDIDAWAFALIPYFLYQFIRSIAWAIKTIRARSETTSNRWKIVSYEEAKQHKLYGVGGWLYVLLLQMGLGVLAAIGNWVAFKHQYAEMPPAEQALNDVVLAFNNLQVVLNVILGLMIVLTMMAEWSRFRFVTSIALATSFPLALLIAAVMGVPTIGQFAEHGLPPYAAMCLIWLPYLHFSKRVRVTFDRSVKQH